MRGHDLGAFEVLRERRNVVQRARRRVGSGGHRGMWSRGIESHARVLAFGLSEILNEGVNPQP